MDTTKDFWIAVFFRLLCFLAGAFVTYDAITDEQAADLAEQGYTLQWVDTKGGESRWMVVEQ